KISFQSNFKGDLFIIYYLFFKASLIDLVIPKLIPSCHVTNWREASLLSSKVLLISLTLSASSFKMSLKKDCIYLSSSTSASIISSFVGTSPTHSEGLVPSAKNV